MDSESESTQKVKSERPGQTCIKCNVLLTDENWRKTGQKYCQYKCKACANKETTAWRNSKTDAEYLHYSAKARAKRRGREFTITVADVEAVDTDICSILGIPIKRYPHKSESGRSGIQQPDSKSLDRIDSRFGYIPGNIRVISWRANELLKDATPEELDKITAYHLSTTV